MIRFFKHIFLNQRFFIVLGSIALSFIISYFYPSLLPFANALLFTFVILILLDYFFLFNQRVGFWASRKMAARLSNGDNNPIEITLESNYNIALNLKIIDEVPFQFQARNIEFIRNLSAGEHSTLVYTLRPTKRGVYNFGSINIYASTSQGLISRRFTFASNTDVPVYPSIIQMKKFEFFAISNRLSELGVKKVRKIGHQFEFEQIREYVQGDDYRTINWKATARRGQFMVNQFQDEKSQNIYCLIDKGRAMKMPFENLSLMDYSINAALVLSNIAIRKYDKAGIITFAENKVTVLPAERNVAQIEQIAHMLHSQKTRYLESNYEMLYTQVRRKINQRSLLILFTNFESLSSMQRNLKYFKSLAKSHVLVVVFFENTEVKKLLNTPSEDLEQVYIKTIAEKFMYEKRQIVKELNKHGIFTLLTAPADLTINTINKYLELKARGVV